MLVGAVMQRLGVASIVCAAMVAATAATGSVAAGYSCVSDAPVYTVRSGDSWFAIATRVGVPTSDLLAANDAELDDGLVVSDQLCLPSGADLSAACEASHTVVDGEGWGWIAQRAGVAVAEVLAANGADTNRVIHPGDVVCLPASSHGDTGSTAGHAASGVSAGRSYTVASGDNWYDIASRAGITLGALLGANDANEHDRLLPGDVLALPAGASTPAGTTRGSGGGLGVLPVQGPCWYTDTWRDPRGGGRRHEGVDLLTAEGRYVYAVADGRLTGRRWDQSGQISGNSWNLVGEDGTSYFYAHLSGFAPDLKVGSSVEAGEIIGWVGETGNASAPHLHFEIHPGGGAAVNPYPAVKAAGGCNSGTPYTQPSGWVPD